MQRSNLPASQVIAPVELTPEPATPVDAEQSQEAEVGEEMDDDVAEEEDDEDESPETGMWVSITLQTSNPASKLKRVNPLPPIY